MEQGISRLTQGITAQGVVARWIRIRRPNMNSVALIGRLTKDPDVRWTQDQMAIASFSIAIDRPPRKDGSKETDYPRITVFGRQAENCEKYLKKGRMVGITGRIQTGSYEKDGQKVFTTDIVADRVEFLEWGDKTQQTQPQAPQQAYQQGYVPQPAPRYVDAEQARQTINKTLGINARFADQPVAQQQMPVGFETIQDDDIPF